MHHTRYQETRKPEYLSRYLRDQFTILHVDIYTPRNQSTFPDIWQGEDQFTILDTVSTHAGTNLPVPSLISDPVEINGSFQITDKVEMNALYQTPPKIRHYANWKATPISSLITRFNGGLHHVKTCKPLIKNITQTASNQIMWNKKKCDWVFNENLTICGL